MIDFSWDVKLDQGWPILLGIDQWKTQKLPSGVECRSNVLLIGFSSWNSKSCRFLETCSWRNIDVLLVAEPIENGSELEYGVDGARVSVYKLKVLTSGDFRLNRANRPLRDQSHIRMNSLSSSRKESIAKQLARAVSLPAELSRYSKNCKLLCNILRDTKHIINEINTADYLARGKQWSVFILDIDILCSLQCRGNC